MWNRIIANATTEDGLPWVAVTDNAEVVGFASSGPARSSEFAGYGELYALYLLTAWKGRGIGRKLFSKAKADLETEGFAKIMLWVLKENPTLGFYLKHGGGVVSEKVEIIGGARLVECALVWQL